MRNTTAAAVTLAIGSLTMAMKPPQYSVTAILENANSDCLNFASVINESGHVAGSIICGAGFPQPAVWYGRGSFDVAACETPCDGQASGINDRGDLAGTIGTRAFHFVGGRTVLIDPADGYNGSEGYDLNNAGQVVGRMRQSVTGDPPARGYVWADGSMTIIEPNIPNAVTQANEINNRGHVAGTIQTNGIDARAFLWTPDGITSVLPPVQGGITSFPVDLNEHDEILARGRVNLPDGYTLTRSYLWRGDKPIPIEGPEDHPNVKATGLNDLGMVGGIAQMRGETQSGFAFLWRDGEFWDVHTLVAELDASFLFLEVRGINKAGRLAVRGKIGSGPAAVFILDPAPLPGDLNSDLRVRFDDLLTLLTSWGPCTKACPSDIDGDGTTDTTDLQLLLADWTG